MPSNSMEQKMPPKQCCFLFDWQDLCKPYTEDANRYRSLAKIIFDDETLRKILPWWDDYFFKKDLK